MVRSCLGARSSGPWVSQRVLMSHASRASAIMVHRRVDIWVAPSHFACKRQVAHYSSHARFGFPMPDTLPAPLGGSPPAEVSLPHAPLVRVVAQVRFPGILKIDDKRSLVPFQEEIRGTYPLFQQEASQQLHVEMGPNGPNVRQGVSNVWRFADPEQAWRLSLTTDMIALEPSRYTSRADFLARWTRILAAVERAFNPQIALRVGLRYVDRVTGDALSTIQDMVRKDVLGVAMPELREHVR